jgi:hypothetical protein
MDIRNDALGPMPVWFLSKQGALDVVSREYDVAIQSEEKFGVPVLQPESPESPSAGHLNPIYVDCRKCGSKTRTRSRICRGYMPSWR